MKKLLCLLAFLAACEDDSTKRVTVTPEVVEIPVEVPAEPTEPTTPTEPTEPTTPVQPDPSGSIVSLIQCNGGGGPYSYDGIIEKYTDGSTRVHLTIRGPQGAIEAVELKQSAADTALYNLASAGPVDGPLSNRLDFPITEGYREKLGLMEGARLFTQIRRSAVQGGFYLFVGQQGDETRHEYIGLNPYSCWSVTE